MNSVQNRSLGLDALRGFAILAMFLSGQIPFFENTLPNWMYHAQLPPPAHRFDPNLPGLTWVDLVFPLFLFAMGAAFPLAISKKIARGSSNIKILSDILLRFVQLAGFAIYIQHIKPYALSKEPEFDTWLISLIGFVLIFPVLLRLPKNFPDKFKIPIRAAGLLGMIVLLTFLRYPDGSGFSLGRSDIIILVLSNTALFGSIVWLYTRNNLLARILILALLLAFRLSHNEIGIIKEIWDFSPFPWLYKFYYLQYLFIVIPGTFAGDLILKWMNTEKEITPLEISKRIYCFLLAGLPIITVVVLSGLQSRWVGEVSIASVIFVITGYFILRDSSSGGSIFLKNLFYIGSYALIIGLIFEPFEGGIKKDHSTLSYYFVSTALSVYLLICFTLLIDFLNKSKWFDILIANGQNPMIAYAGITNLIPPLLGMTLLNEYLNGLVADPLTGLLKGVFVTILLGWIVGLFTKRKIFLRT